MNRSIRYLLSSEIVKKRYKQLHGREANTTKARTIALHVEQGINFLESASNAPVTIRPLLQFYGVAALARAVTLFLNPKLTHESTLTSGHGLEVVNWNELHEERSDRGFPQLNIKTTKGLFTDLNKATDGRAVFYANSSAPNWPIKLGKISLGTVINLADIIGLLPDLWQEYEQWTGVKKERAELQSCKLNNPTPNENTLEINTEQSVDECKKLISTGLISVTQKSENKIQLIFRTGANFQPVQLHHGAFDIGDTLLVPPIDTKHAFSTIAIYYILAYVMSMLARYRLTDWLAVWQREKGDSARPVFEQIMGVIQDEYLQICANLMDGKGK